MTISYKHKSHSRVWTSSKVEVIKGHVKDFAICRIIQYYVCVCVCVCVVCMCVFCEVRSKEILAL